MAEYALLRLARSEILALHETEVGGRRAESKAVALIVSPHAREADASVNVSLEMKEVGKLDIIFWRLIVVAVLVEPGNGKRACAAIEWASGNGRTAILGGKQRRSKARNRGATGERGAELQKAAPGNRNEWRRIPVVHGKTSTRWVAGKHVGDGRVDRKSTRLNSSHI